MQTPMLVFIKQKGMENSKTNYYLHSKTNDYTHSKTNALNIPKGIRRVK